MPSFFQSHTILFLILISAIGFLAGCIIYKLMFYIPQSLLKNWRMESWQCLYPQRAIPIEISNTKITTLQFATIFLPFRKERLKRIFIQPSWYFLGLTSCSTLLSLFIANRFGPHWITVANLILTWGLLLLACIDLKHYLLPDCLTLPLLWLGLFCNTFALFVPIYAAVWGAMLGYLSLWLVARLFKYFRGLDGIGQGDFKLLALFGAWWGFASLPAILMAASLSGAVVGFIQLVRGRHSLRKPLAFGPYLILNALALLFFPSKFSVFFIHLY